MADSDLLYPAIARQAYDRAQRGEPGALAAELGQKPEFVAADWETIIPALQRREFDLIVNGLEPTPDRAQAILFSRPYYVFSLVLTVRRRDAGRNGARQ